MLIDRISKFLAEPERDDLDALALAAFAYQFENIAPYRSLCQRRGVQPGTVSRWQDIPLIPTSAFRSVELAAAPPLETFRSSGTGGGEERRSTHLHPFPDLYRRVIDASFPRYCLPQTGRLPIASLVPSRADLPDSSLAFMAAHVVGRYGSAESIVALGARGLDFVALRSWCSARQRDRQPSLVFTTALALLSAIERFERLGLRFRLPAGTVVLETGGFKGREREASRDDLLARLDERFGVPANRVVREYGMTELTSQCYTRVLAGGDADLFVTPPWMRVRVLDPLTLEEAPAGTTGLIAILDLANVGSALHLLTEDLGIAEEGGFRLAGRAAGAELRGCSLAAEELERAAR